MSDQGRVFSFLLAYRWAALLPALWLLVQAGGMPGASPGPSPALLFGMVAAINLLITLTNRVLNRWVIRFPLLLGLDLLFSAAILAWSGGLQSPYYIYALSPLLAGAFFFQMRGALAASAAFTPLYLAAEFLQQRIPSFPAIQSAALLTQAAGIWLIPVLFAYASTLLKTISQAREDLATARDELARKHQNLGTAHRQLEIIHDLTVLLQSATDMVSIQQRILGAVTTDLGFSRALIAVVDPSREEMGNWEIYPGDQSFPAVDPVPLKPENGPGVRALLERKPFRSNGQPILESAELAAWLEPTSWLVLPLYLREHPVGLLLVALDPSHPLSAEREGTLMTVANQAALALGTTLLCIDRARRLAVEQERNRIAREIHDTVAQSLFGIVYSLEACINMLPAQADSVRDELIELRALASGAHEEVRRSIFDMWPSALNLEVFRTDIRSYVNQCCRPRSFQIDFRVTGDFDNLSPGLRRTIYRMAQEALANSARHSGVDTALLCMNIGKETVYINIEDRGRGFDVDTALKRNLNREHFGLQGIRERARAMGGECEIVSQPEAGTRLIISLPVAGARSRAVA
ncbi:MAG: GAF domain-containing sensor histidine kinase [Bacteroidota bacterium]